MNQPPTSAPAPDGAKNNKNNAPPGSPAKVSTLHYEGPKEPPISAWFVAGVVAVLLVVGYLLVKSSQG
jgi:hypothetical protein